MRFDWSENSNIFQTRQEKGAYYQNFQGSVHPMVIYAKDYLWEQYLTVLTTKLLLFGQGSKK